MRKTTSSIHSPYCQNQFPYLPLAKTPVLYAPVHMKTKLATLLVTVLLFCSFTQADSLDDLARDFWTWRAIEQPVSSDDIPRIERPSSWVPDWSPEAVARYHKQLDEFDSRWQKMTRPPGRSQDRLTIGS